MKKIFTLSILLICVGLVNGQFTPGNLVVYRVGTGTGSLVNTGNAIFLDEYTTAGVLVQSIALPTAASGSNFPICASGTATSEGLMTLSSNGQYLIATGYGVAPGYASSLTSTASATVNRIVAVIDANGNINTTTALTDFSTGNNPRTATSSDGTNIWVGGAAGGVRYTTLGATTSTQLATTPTNIRQLNIFNGQLYESSSSSPFLTVSSVGTGLPTTSGQTVTVLPGTTNTGTSNYGFYLATLAAGQVLYITDNTASTITKYSLVSGTWTSNGTVTATGIIGLTGSVNGASVTLYGTTGASTATGGGSLYKVTDASGYNATMTGTVTTIASVTNTSNTAFRGVAIAPGYIWTGTTSTDWNTATNWLYGAVPPSASTTQIAIPVVSSNNYPSVTSSVTAGTITVQPGAFLSVASGQTLTISNKLYLKSDATGTASIGNSAGSIVGTATVERYIPGGRRVFRFLAHPFSSSLATSSLTDNIDITGTGGTPFTTTTTNSPSAYKYDNSTGDPSLANDPGWTALTASSTFDPLTGYRILVRGSKAQTGSLTGGTYTPDPVTLDWSGTLNVGNKTFNTIYNGAIKTYNLIGNPYASPINLNLVTRGSYINANFSIWDATAGTRGAYVTQAFSSSYILPSGGAFFVQNGFANSPTANAAITFTEACKSTSTPVSIFGTGTSEPQLLLQVNDQNGNYSDRLQFFFGTEKYSNKYDALWDATKITNPDVNFYSFSKDGNALAIDRRPLVNDTIALGFTTTTVGTYQLLINELPSNTNISLIDKLNNTSTLLEAGKSIDINITADAASQGNNRFELVFANAKAQQQAETLSATDKFTVNAVSSRGNITVNYTASKAGLTTVRLVGINGEVLQSQSLGVQQSGKTILNTSGIASGIYVVEVKIGEDAVTKKVITQ
jgi:hypothetical protein